ncbi:ABC transporter ATP-binding protein [Paroceanicella profunda]|uniref:ABC transporter ATP-binding protein n=1 Tax=Paroceanicella profunda TaxID=2579971 RepID=A0A5B8FH67_9RHOB|nr:ABC transporter ATP-binding protein [Paroceanicella profunda]QDL91668.1 ABC transporter ATP-binding protein [Paroceanicella profunda]
MTEVSILSLVKRYGTALAVNDVTLKVNHGEFVSLLGPSGCGKSTTLKCIAGFETVSDGRILFDGHDISNREPEDRDIGMVFQSYALFPHMTVAGNLAFGLEMRRVARDEITRRVADVMELVQLSHYAGRYPRELSGGQQQRVALARALVIEPAILLLDEPLANLDAKLRDEMRTFIRDLQKRVGITTLYVTHDQGEAMTMSDRVVVMFDGRIAQAAAPEDVYDRPASEAVARFVGNANILTGTVEAAGEGRVSLRFGSEGTLVSLPGAAAPGSRLRVMARPEQVRLTAPGAEADASGTVVSHYFNGGFIDYRVRVGADEIMVHAPTAHRFADGAAVGLAFDPARLWPLEGAA